MNHEPKEISSEGEAAIRLVEEGVRSLLEAGAGEVMELCGDGRWEAVMEGGVLDYIPAHSVCLSVRCCRECCEDAPDEARHALMVSVTTYFLDGDRPLTDVGFGEMGFSFGAFQQLVEVVSGLSESSPRYAPDAPGIVAEVERRMVMLLRALERADGIEEDLWYERE